MKIKRSYEMLVTTHKKTLRYNQYVTIHSSNNHCRLDFVSDIFFQINPLKSMGGAGGKPFFFSVK